MSTTTSVGSAAQLFDAVSTYWRDSSEQGDDSRHVRRKSQHLLVRRYKSHRPRVLRISMILTILLGLLVALQLFTAFSIESILHAPSSILGLASWKYSQEDGIFSTSLCPSCNQTANATEAGTYATAQDFSRVPLPSRDEARSRYASLAGRKRYLLHHIVLMSIMDKTWMNAESTAEIFKNYFSRPDDLLSLSFDGLDLDKPTTYMYTRTGPGGKLHEITNRVHHLDRHGKTLVQFQDLITEKGYLDGQPKDSRQIIWIVIEDDATIDPRISEYLESLAQPYLYFAHGPTRWLGVAQWNAVERAVEVLRDTFFGDGPVMNVDDDARIDPELLRHIWKVKRAIHWPVGNLRGGNWEGALYKDGAQARWLLGGMPHRTFPIDMNGFAINSTLIGEGREIHGPKYISDGWTGAETKFIEKIYKKRAELEGICENTVEEGCFWAWWNWNENESKNAKPPRSLAEA